MKLAGFLTGGGVAAIGLVVWSALTTVTDDMRLDRMLTACLTYVTTGAAPFAGDGRAVGVYDAPLLEGDYVADTHRILDDNRFEAAWEQINDAEKPMRLCRVTARWDGADQMAFVLDEGTLIPRVTEILSVADNLIPETNSITDGPRTLLWSQNGMPQSEGLRVVLIATPTSVGSFLVGMDLEP